jgi:hypothetical protein
MMVMICFSFGAAPMQNPGHQLNILHIFKAKEATGLRATCRGIKEI